MDSHITLNQLLHETQSCPGSLYYVKSMTRGRGSDEAFLLKKIEKAQARGLVLSPHVSAEEFKALQQNTRLPMIQRMSPLTTPPNPARFFEILVHGSQPGEFEKACELLSQTENVLLEKSYFVFKDISLGQCQQLRLVTNHPLIFFEFSNYSSQNEATRSVAQIREMIYFMHQNGVEMRPPPGRPIYDSSIPQNLELEPLVPLAYQSKKSTHVDFSIIIPTYNSKYFLLNVLKHLYNLDFAKERYEILVIDDGSTDGSQSYITSHFERHGLGINLKYFYFERPQKRQLGDSYFRAGLSRNIGANQAEGRYLTFLDSDILCPPNFLTQLEKDLQKADIVQNVRFHIKPEASNEHISFEQMSKAETYIEDSKYWGPFFDTNHWHGLAAFWKYTCTYCLSVKKDQFLKLGRFRRNFVSYGFEDTDLGYRFYQAGQRFHLSKNYTLHLTPQRTESEYKHSKTVRHQLLSKTAKKFFLNNLDPFIFDHLNVYMGGEHPTLRKVNLLLKKQFKSFFLRHREFD